MITRTAPTIALFVLAIAGLAVADVPRKAPPGKYTGLWTNSPFTSKPPPPPPAETIDIFADYALGGVSPISTGYRVTLLNKKKPEEKIIVDSGDSKAEFKILEVNRKPGDPLGTVVKMSGASGTGTVAFDEKLLVLATPPAPKAGAKPPGAVPPPGSPPPQVQPGQPSTAGRLPRPRVVPPPATGGAPATPTAVAPAAPVMPTMPSGGYNNSNSHRPIRRGGR